MDRLEKSVKDILLEKEGKVETHKLYDMINMMTRYIGKGIDLTPEQCYNYLYGRQI